MTRNSAPEGAPLSSSGLPAEIDGSSDRIVREVIPRLDAQLSWLAAGLLGQEPIDFVAEAAVRLGEAARRLRLLGLAARARALAELEDEQ